MNKRTFTGLVLMLASCQEITREKTETVARTQLEERQSNQLRERMAACTREIYSAAQSRADSILKIESKQAKFDSINVPHDTFRPARPEVAFPDFAKPSRDSIKIRPASKK